LRSETRPFDDCLDGHRFRKIVGGAISPLLANIYLNELDRFVEKTLVPAYARGERRKANPPYKHYERQIDNARSRGNLDEVKRLKQERRLLMSVDPMDADYRRLHYVRYADDFLLGLYAPIPTRALHLSLGNKPVEGAEDGAGRGAFSLENRGNWRS
jgi:hypothetical protein